MRDLRTLDIYRRTDQATLDVYGWAGDHTCGVFSLKSPIDNTTLLVIASSGEGWDHISVSRKDMIPVWREMEFIKRKFFKEDEVAMQLHVSPKDHISRCNNCLHLWRPTDREIPLPPVEFVG